MAGGLSTDKLEELRKQREQARAQKKAEEEQAKKAEEEKLQKEQAEQQKKAEKERAEKEKKEQERKAELEKIEKEKAELKAQLEKEKQEKLENQKRHSEELAKEKEKQIELLKEEKRKVEEDKEKTVKEKNEEIKQLKQEKKSAEEKLAKKEADSKKEKKEAKKEPVSEVKEPEQPSENAKKEVNEPVAENETEESDKVETVPVQPSGEAVFDSKVKVVNDEPVIIENNKQEEDEEGKVQVGFTMVDKSLVSEAKDNKRYGIKERSPLFKKLNNIVFYVAIPFMLVWAVLAFGGVCTAKVGHTSFANNIYYKVNNQTSIDGYKNGNVLSIRSSSLSDVKVDDVIAIQFTNKETGNKTIQLVHVTSVSPDATNLNAITITFKADNTNAVLEQYNIVADKEYPLTTGKDVKFMGILTGKDAFLGSFLMLSQNIVAFIFIVIVPAGIILSFQFINLYDSIKLYVKQKKISQANKKQTKKTDDRDKIRR